MNLLEREIQDEISIYRDRTGFIWTSFESKANVGPPEILQTLLHAAQMVAAAYGLTITIAPNVVIGAPGLNGAERPAGGHGK